MPGISSPRSGRALYLAETPSPEFLSVDSSAPAVWGGVPLRNSQVVVREELLASLGNLVADLPFEPVPVVLNGMVGVGKTQLALEYVYRHRNAYGLVWWIDTESPATSLNGFTKLAQALALPTTALSADEVIAQVHESLRKHQNGRWLLVFDSASSPETLGPLLPNAGSGDILVTSRSPHWAGLGRTLEIPVLKLAEGKALLNSLGFGFTEDEAEALIEVVGGLPLALSHLALWQKEAGTSTKELTRLLSENTADLFLSSTPADKAKSLADSWLEVAEELNSYDAKAYSLLQLCAFLNAKKIPTALFSKPDSHSPPDELLNGLRENAATVSKCVQTLHRRGLCTVDSPSDQFNVHPMVQWLVKSQMSPQLLELYKRKVHSLLRNLLPEDANTGKNWLIFHNSVAHIHASGLVEDDDPEVARLALQILNFLANHIDYSESISLAHKVLNSCVEKFGENDKQTLGARAKLGFVLWVSGDYQGARECNARTFELHQKFFPLDYEASVSILLNLAIDLRTEGDFLRSYETDNATYEKGLELLDPHNTRLLDIANNLSVSARCAGHTHRALEISERTYQSRLKILGPYNIRTLAIRAGRALDWQTIGQFARAGEELEEIVATLEVYFEGFEPEILYRKHQLAVAKRKSGDFKTALEISQEVMSRLSDRTLRHANMIECLLGYSLDLRYNNDLEGSCREGERALKAYQKILGKEHPFSLAAQINLAITMRQQGTDLQAKQLSLEALKLLPSRVGRDHPYMIIGAINHASILGCLGDSTNALEQGKKTVTQAIRVLGRKHPVTLNARANYTLDLRGAGKIEGEKHYPQVLADHHEIFGNAHPYTIAVAEGRRIDCDIDPASL